LDEANAVQVDPDPNTGSENIGEGSSVVLGNHIAALVSPLPPWLTPKRPKSLLSNPLSVKSLSNQPSINKTIVPTILLMTVFTWVFVASQEVEYNAPFIEYLGLACHYDLPPMVEECMSQIKVPQPKKPHSEHLVVAATGAIHHFMEAPYLLS
jgi:hypothetical protein